MAKRNVDVVVGARTDAASFQKAEQRTRGFFARLRGASGGGGGESTTDAALQRTSRAAETLSKVVQIGAILKEGIGAFNASVEVTRGIMAGLKGDAEAFDASMIAAGDAISKTLVGAVGTSLGEAIFGDKADAQRIIDGVNRAEQARLASISKIVAAQKRLNQIEDQGRDINLDEFRRAERMLAESKGSEGDIETFNIQRDADARIKRISVLEAEALAMGESAQKQEVLANLERARGRVIENMATEIARADEARAEALQGQIDAIRKVADTEARLFGKEGVDREIELIRMRTEAREEEIAKLVEAAETDKQRIELAKLLADVQSQAASDISAAREADIEPEKPRRIERAGLASAQEGLSISGIAAAAQANQAIERQKQQVAEDTKKNTKETAEILGQLLNLWRSGGSVMPILN